MTIVWINQSTYRIVDYTNEKELEAVIERVQNELFGSNRIYIEIKKKIGNNIPDGYLIDLNSRNPRLYVVENELARHDPLRHIAMQLLEFSLSFEAEPRKVQKILLGALEASPDKKTRCEAYAASRGFRGLDHLLDELVHSTPFAALVIIDQVPERLRGILAQKFRFPVEVLELAKYVSASNEHLYRFEPFLAGLEEDLQVGASNVGVPRQPRLDMEEVDTVVVPAREEGFQRTFLGEDRWYQIRLDGIMRPQIRWIAVYQTAPHSAITHVAPVQSIEPWEDSDKVVVNFTEPAREITPIVRGERLKHLQNIKYTTYQRLLNAKTLDDL